VTSPRPVPPSAPRPLAAAELLRSVGLMADGPVTWGRPVQTGGPGVYLVEWPEPRADAPVELTLVGKWLERLPAMRLDGARPSSREVAARLHDFWLPGQVVVYVGRTTASIGGRVGAFYRTPLGERGPHAGGQWLQTLRGLARARVWWAVTDAPEEYEDALIGAFAATVDATAAGTPRLPDREVILPFANLQSATGARKAHGLTGTVQPRPPEQPTPGTTLLDLPDGTADGVVESVRARPLEVRSVTPPPPPESPVLQSVLVPPPSTPSSPSNLRGPAARVDLVKLNDALQGIVCRQLARESSVADAAGELTARGFLRETRAQPVAVLRDLLKQGLIEGGVQDADQRWAIRCVRERGR
jgi:hypothetical protein